MNSTKSFAIAAVLILAGVAGWVGTNTQTSVAATTGGGIEPFQMMLSANQLPAQHFDDYSFIY